MGTAPNIVATLINNAFTGGDLWYVLLLVLVRFQPPIIRLPVTLSTQRIGPPTCQAAKAAKRAVILMSRTRWRMKTCVMLLKNPTN